MSDGAFFGMIGLPGSGKSALSKLLAATGDVRSFCEPEEPDWPELVNARDRYGHFQCLQWFRLTRVTLAYMAHHARSLGEVCTVDSVFDYIMSDMLQRIDASWIIDRNNPYFQNYMETAVLDASLLPKLDGILAVRVDEASWDKMIQKRNRALDVATGVGGIFHQQDAILEAAADYANRQRIPIVEIKNSLGTLGDTTEAAREAITSMRSSLATR